MGARRRAIGRVSLCGLSAEITPDGSSDESSDTSEALSAEATCSMYDAVCLSLFILGQYMRYVDLSKCMSGIEGCERVDKAFLSFSGPLKAHSCIDCCLCCLASGPNALGCARLLFVPSNLS